MWIVNKETSSKDLVKQLGEKPYAINEKEGAEEYVYQSQYYDYVGDMKYYITDDFVTFNCWEYTADTEEDAKTVYADIKKKLENKYQSGTEAESQDTCQWRIEEKNITIGYSNPFYKYPLKKNYQHDLL